MPLADSLKLKSYTVSLYDINGKQLLISNDFKIEDYQLNIAKYDLRSSKNTYNKGDIVSIYLSGKDVNGMNLMDSRVSLELKTKHVGKYINDNLFIPNNIWKHEAILDQIGETKIIIPDSVFPLIEANYSLNVVFNNSNNETHKDRLEFNYSSNSKFIETRIHNDSIYANYYVNGVNISTNGKLERYEDGEDKLIEADIRFPYKEKIDTRYIDYSFIKGNIEGGLDIDDEDILLECDYSRNKDSIFINFINPRNIPFIYTIYKKNNTIVESGNVVGLHRAFETKTTAPYSISYQYQWASQNRNIEHIIRNYENNLNVKLIQPYRILPGQTVDVKVKVTDFDNNDVENANVLVSSVNSKFEESSIPEVSSWNKYYKPRKKYPSLNKKALYSNSYNKIHKNLYHSSNVDTIAFYNFIFPKNGIVLNYDSSHNIKNAQFTPHIYNRGLPIEIHIIYVDDKLMYFSGSLGRTPNSFIIPEGKHNIKLRTYNKEYIINNVELIKGNKLDFSLDVNNLPDTIIVNEKNRKLDIKEKLDLSYKLLITDYIHCSGDIYIWQGDNIININKNQRNNINILGPFNQGVKLNYAIKDTKEGTFVFKPNRKYIITDDTVKSRGYYFTNDEISLDNIVYGDNDFPIGLVKNKEEIILKTPVSKYAHLTTQSFIKRSTIEDEGLYEFDYIGDSLFELIAIKKQDTASYFQFYPGKMRKIHGLEPGRYDIVFVTISGNYLTKDSVSIYKNGINYNRFGDNELSFTNPIILEKVNLIKLDKLIKDKNTTYYIKDNDGALFGRITDSETEEPIPFANIIVSQGGRVVNGASSDLDGKFKIIPVPAGNYDVRVSFVGYSTTLIKGVNVNIDKIRILNIKLESSYENMENMIVRCYSMPLIDRDAMSDRRNRKINTYTIGKMAGRSGESTAVTVGGVFSQENATYVDGVRVIGSSSLPQSAVEEVAIIKLSLAEGIETEDSYGSEDKVVAEQKSSIRTNFKDYAYWQPNLITNSEGEVEFTAKFPDDITKWKNYAVAMNFNRQSGIGVSETKAIKMLMAQLSTPRFLIEGDKTNVIGKVSNYLDKEQLIKTKFSLNENILATYDTAVTTSFIKSQQITATGIDTLKVAYSFQREDGYSDGEQREIPVFAKGVEQTDGEFYSLYKDTVINIELDKNAKVELSAQSNILEALYEDIEDVQNYRYMCMEQTASKLTVYILEEQICRAMGKKFTNKRKVNKLIKRLEKGQNDDGSWGWWPNSKTNMWMTTYVTKALSFAKANGYSVKSLTRAFQIMTWELDLLEGNSLLNVLSSFTDIGFEFNYTKYLSRIELEEPTVYQKLTILKIKQHTNPKISIEPLLKDAKHTVMGNIYWGETNFSWYNNSNRVTLLAYNIIKKSDSLHPYLPLIRNYFIEAKANNRWSNTIDKSQILATILPDFIKETGFDGNIISPKLSITGDYNAEVSEFPYTTTLPQGVEELQITKSGTGPIYFSSFTKNWNANPEVKNETFEINTWFELDGKRIDTLIAGKVVELKVNIKVKKMANYVMIEIPIPAGCSYDDNRRREAYWEVHRQYYKNKTSIFSENLNVGEYTISIKLQPRFSGAYTLNPAKAELMYFPVFYGNNGLKTTVIE